MLNRSLHLPIIYPKAATDEQRGQQLEPIEIARKAVEVASDKQAADILLLDVRGLCSFADYFVICSGETERQVHAICDDIYTALHSAGVRGHREGDDSSGWVLLDYSGVIIHVFNPALRQYYQLEELWASGKPVLRVQ